MVRESSGIHIGRLVALKSGIRQPPEKGMLGYAKFILRVGKINP
jgi:hypothetical protein